VRARVHLARKPGSADRGAEGALAVSGGAGGFHLDGRTRRWPIKLAPFLIPPFRTLFMNEHGDFFAGTPAGVLRHAGIALAIPPLGLESGKRHSSRRMVMGVRPDRAAFLALSRWAFRKWHGQSRWPQGGTGNLPVQSVAAFRYQPRRWNWDELSHFVQSATARYLLFQTTDGDFSDLLPLFSTSVPSPCPGK